MEIELTGKTIVPFVIFRVEYSEREMGMEATPWDAIGTAEHECCRAGWKSDFAIVSAVAIKTKMLAVEPSDGVEVLGLQREPAQPFDHTGCGGAKGKNPRPSCPGRTLFHGCAPGLTMPIKSSGRASLDVIDRFGDADDGGVGWFAYPEEEMLRASHALTVDGEVWLLDPLDADGLDDLLAESGDVAGVVVLLDRHKRDAAAVANRYDVSVHIPDWMTGVASKLNAPVKRLNGRLPGTDYEVRKLVDNTFWQEGLVSDGETLYVPEALGRAGFFRTDDERVGVHPALRLFPPRSLQRYQPERLLVGHGPGLHEDVPTAIRDTVSNARSRAPRLYLETAQALLT